MAAKKNEDVPPVPVPPPGAAAEGVVSPAVPVPPVEPAAAPVPPVETAPTPPANPYGQAPAGSAPPAGTNPYGAVPGQASVSAAAPPAQPVAGNPYGATGPMPGYAPQGPVAPQGLSITSMILGIAGVVLSVVSLGFLPALAAVITGHLATKRQPHAKPFWLTGIITGYVGIGISVIWFLAIFVPIIIGLFVLGGVASFS